MLQLELLRLFLAVRPALGAVEGLADQRAVQVPTERDLVLIPALFGCSHIKCSSPEIRREALGGPP